MTPLEQIIAAMDERDVSRTELARRMGVSRSQVTNMLVEGHNFTIDTLDRIAVALNADLEISFPQTKVSPR